MYIIETNFFLKMLALILVTSCLLTSEATRPTDEQRECVHACNLTYLSARETCRLRLNNNRKPVQVTRNKFPTPYLPQGAAD